MRRTSLAVMAALPLAAGACASSGAADAAVTMTGAARFEPAGVTIPVGGTVVWHNDGVTRHTVTAIDEARAPTGAFDSGVVEGTGTFELTFDEPGAYTYTCTIHGGEMVGVVSVGGS